MKTITAQPGRCRICREPEDLLRMRGIAMAQPTLCAECVAHATRGMIQ